MNDRIALLLGRPDVAAAESWIEARDERTLELQIAVTSIPAPTGGEAARGGWVMERFREIGLVRVRADDVGNVLGQYGEGPGPGIAIASHLDTVFSDRAVRVERHEARVTAPGIGDNGRGLAALLTLAEACVECDVRCPLPLTFVATVGEEGEGDLRGVKHLFAAGFRPAAFIALDGPGLERVVHRATGSRRLRAAWRGPGGHSWAAFGVPNPVHAAGAAAAAIAAIPLPAQPRTTLSVVRIGGGTGLNTIPTEAWLDLDLRSEADEEIARVQGQVGEALKGALEHENRRRAAGTAPLALEVVTLGDRPSGVTPEDHPLVRAALAATHAMGAAPALASASTDANVPIARGVPAIALGAGGRGGDAHLVTEWYENHDAPAGIVRALLVALAAAEAAA